MAAFLLAGLTPVASAAALRPIANIFKPLSAPAEAVYDVSLLALLVCAGIFIVVGGLLSGGLSQMLRSRRRAIAIFVGLTAVGCVLYFARVAQSATQF